MRRTFGQSTIASIRLSLAIPRLAYGFLLRVVMLVPLLFFLVNTGRASTFSILTLSPSEQIRDSYGLTSNHPDSSLEIDGFLPQGRVTSAIGLVYAPPIGHAEYIRQPAPRNGTLPAYSFRQFTTSTTIETQKDEISFGVHAGTELATTEQRARLQGAFNVASRLATMVIYGHSDRRQSIPEIPNQGNSIGADFIYDANSGTRFIGGMGYGKVLRNDSLDYSDAVRWNRMAFDGRPEGGAIEEYSLRAGTWQTTHETSLQTITKRTIDEYGNRIEFRFRARPHSDWSVTPSVGWNNTHLTDNHPIPSVVSSRYELSASGIQADVRLRWQPRRVVGQSAWHWEGQAGFVDYLESPSTSNTSISSNTHGSNGAGYSTVLEWRAHESNLRPGGSIEYAHLLTYRPYGEDQTVTVPGNVESGVMLRPFDVARITGSLDFRYRTGRQWKLSSWIEVRRQQNYPSDTTLSISPLNLYRGVWRLSSQTQLLADATKDSPLSLRIRIGGNRGWLTMNSDDWNSNRKLTESERWGGEITAGWRLIGSKSISEGTGQDRLSLLANGGYLALREFRTSNRVQRMVPWQIGLCSSIVSTGGTGSPQSVALAVGSVSHWLSETVDSRTTVTLSAKFSLEHSFTRTPNQ